MCLTQLSFRLKGFLARSHPAALQGKPSLEWSDTEWTDTICRSRSFLYGKPWPHTVHLWGFEWHLLCRLQ